MAEVGIVGLGVMGSNLALNIEEKGFPIAVWNLEPETTERFAADHRGRRITPTSTFEELVAALERPRRILVMIQAGDPVDQVLRRITPLLDEGDVVVDGGNSFFEDTERRERDLSARGVHFVGMGVSGGAEGARRGPSLMPGGSKPAYERWRPVLESIAAKTEAGPCVTHVGPGGAGHFVKMVHNGIEYGDMQLIAEIYDVLRRALGLDADEIANVFEGWREGPLASFLVDVTARVLRVRDEDSAPLVEKILDVAGQKGTGRWTAVLGLRLGCDVPTIAAAVDARVVSSRRGLRLQLAPKWRPPRRSPPKNRERELAALADALLFGRVAAYAEGMDLIATGSEEHGWEIDRAEIARIWKGGCIIRSALLDVLRRAFSGRSRRRPLWLAPDALRLLKRAQRGARRVVRTATERGIAVPALSAALAHVDALGCDRLPQSLTQAQRDAFGAHTYRRVDRPDEGPFHTDWLGKGE